MILRLFLTIMLHCICIYAMAVTEKWRTHHVEKDGFEWIEVGYRAISGFEDSSYALDKDGNILIAPTCSVNADSYKVIYVPNIYCGFFIRKINYPDDYKQRGEMRICEVYSKSGNLIIPSNRNYGAIRYMPDPGIDYTKDKYIVVETCRGIGLCDLNGFELAEPIYSSYSYDGYDFEGTTRSGQVIRKSIHKRPTNSQKQAINNWGGYYANMPWLMMPGPNYTPTFNIDWNSHSFDWNTVSVYGGVGDYGSPEISTTDGYNSPSHSGSTNSYDCAFCNGTGKKEVNQSVATFGTTDVKVHCNVCGRDFYRSTGHSHVNCGHCGGTGKMR